MTRRRRRASRAARDLSRCRARKIRLPFGGQGRTGNLLSALVDPVDPPGVGDVVERVPVEHNEIGALAGCDRAELIESDDLRGVAGPRHQGLHWREPTLGY